jgi:uncharacterized protein with PQ loop repeat
MSAQVHMHKRKKNKKGYNILDKAIVCLGIANVFATLPQVAKVWGEQSAEGLSSISWGYYTIFSFALLIYGIVHKEKPIILTYIGSTILYAAIFVGSLVY